MAQKKELSLLKLLLVVSFASVLAVLFAPALPNMANEMGLTHAEAQMTLSVFLIGYAVGVLPYGPLSNRYGRRPALFIGAAVALIGSLIVIAAAKTQSFSLMIAGRILTALGSGSGLKVAFTMVGDIYEKSMATKKLSSLLLAFAITPSVGIAIGGFLTDHFGWESCFYFMALYSVFMMGVIYSLPETLKEKNPNALDLVQIKDGLFKMFHNKHVVVAGLLMGCGASEIYLFATIAPFIGIDRIGLSPENYGLLNFIPPVGMALGSLLAQSLSHKKEPQQVILWGVFVSIVASLIMLVSFLAGSLSVWTLFLPMPLLFVGLSLVYSNASAVAMSHTTDKSNASAVMHFLNVGLAVVSLLTVESFSLHSPLILPLCFTVLSVMMYLLRRII